MHSRIQIYLKSVNLIVSQDRSLGLQCTRVTF